jgi:magnesium-transporting ATPase (P-type)
MLKLGKRFAGEGLSHEQAQERLAHYGKNAISKIQKKRFTALAANFTHLMALLLWAGGLASALTFVIVFMQRRYRFERR